MDNKTKILIVEDESIVALDLKRRLIKFGYDITNTVTNYNDALSSVQIQKPDIVLMDVRLENSKDGIETAIAIKAIYNDIIIIYLTAFSNDKNTIDRAFQTNPAAFLPKPYNGEEINSTILLSLYKLKKKNFNQKILSYIDIGHGYYFDEKNLKLFYEEIPIKLSKKECVLLELLIKSKGFIVPFDVIEHTVWSDNTVSKSTLRTLIYRLRTKLGHNLIETIPSIGCKL